MPERLSVFFLYLSVTAIANLTSYILICTFPPDLSKAMVKYHYFHLTGRERYAQSSDVTCSKGSIMLWIPGHALSVAICHCSLDLGTEIVSLLHVMAVGLSHECACSGHLWAPLQSIAGLKRGCITVHNTQSAAVSLSHTYAANMPSFCNC